MSGIVIRPPSVADIDHVCRRLRALDRAEIFALLYGDTADALIEHLVLHASGFLEFHAVAPSAAPHRACGLVGLYPLRPHVAGASFFGTDELGHHIKPVTRWIRRTLIPRAQACGLHRVETQALESWRANCRWLEALGATREAVLPLYGKDGETFVQFAWYGKDTTNVHLGTVRQEVEAA